MEYAIYEGNIERLEKKMTAVQNKCKKYGCDFSYKRVGEEYRDVKDDDGNVHTVRFIIVNAEGVARVNGWKFIASLEHTENGNIINRVCDVEVPERYYNCEAVCEHCGTTRNRKNTYIVMNEETGEFKQVGKSCLRDFTHGMSAEAAASYISIFNDLIEGEAVSGTGWEDYLNTKRFLRCVYETIRNFGYVKKNNEYNNEGTAARALRYYNARSIATCREMRDYGIDIDSEEAEKAVNKVLEWVKTLDEDSNYNHNLKTACSLDYNRYRNIGILASVFPSYNREVAHQKFISEQKRRHKAEADSSKYVGKIGDRLDIEIESVDCLTSWESMYGITCMYKIVGKDGNTYIWKTTSDINENAKMLRGTVKGHNEYNGIKQTELTRCKTIG